MDEFTDKVECNFEREMSEIRRIQTGADIHCLYLEFWVLLPQDLSENLDVSGLDFGLGLSRCICL